MKTFVLALALAGAVGSSASAFTTTTIYSGGRYITCTTMTVGSLVSIHCN